MTSYSKVVAPVDSLSSRVWIQMHIFPHVFCRIYFWSTCYVKVKIWEHRSALAIFFSPWVPLLTYMEVRGYCNETSFLPVTFIVSSDSHQSCSPWHMGSHWVNSFVHLLWNSVTDSFDSLQKLGAATDSWKMGVWFLKTIKATWSQICQMSCVMEF